MCFPWPLWYSKLFLALGETEPSETSKRSVVVADPTYPKPGYVQARIKETQSPVQSGCLRVLFFCTRHGSLTQTQLCQLLWEEWRDQKMLGSGFKAQKNIFAQVSGG